ncbi:MAG TPA: glycine cleavage system protein GcvH [Candidatus Hydrogenedentes bacterium]|nr:glycine cleavage system protein GcvH [Candidatus Hydrogenedentota bacterium]
MVPKERKYTKTHQWICEDDDGLYPVGLTAYAAEQLGEATYVELPELDADVKKGDELGVVESADSAIEVLTPVAGRVAEVNDELEGEPEQVTQSPYERGWLFKLQDVDPLDFSRLMGAKAYENYVAGLDN